MQDQNLAQRSNFIFEDNEEIKKIDIEVENINLKGSGISLVDESLLNHSKLYQ